MPGLLLAGCVLLAGVLGLAAWPWLQQQVGDPAFQEYIESRRPFQARQIETLAELPPELRESSGLAISRSQAGVLWSHNDSGNAPLLYALDISGRLLASFQVEGISARDWEDVAAGPCPRDAGATAGPAPPCLYIADTGDNDRVRDDVEIGVLPEPRVGGNVSSPTVVTARPVRLRYPTEREDTEALAVLPEGDVVLVTKGRTGTIGFFTLPAAQVAQVLGSGERLTLVPAGDAGVVPDARISKLVTGAALSPDARTVAIRTYNEIFFYAIARTPELRLENLNRPCSLGDLEPQGEGIDYVDAETLLLTSERSRGRAGTISRIRC